MFNFYLLYIDPGTGSALFSIFIGAAATLYFLLRALLIKLKFGFFRKKDLSKEDFTWKYVIYCEGKQYWNVFQSIAEEFENNKTELRYLTSSADDPVFETSWNYIKPEYIGEGNKAFAYLNFISAEIVLMTTPGLNVYQLKRSKTVKHYSHILHSPADTTTYKLFSFDYFDSILLTGDYQIYDFRFLEKLRNLPEKKLVTVGCSYLDAYSQKIKQIPKEEDHQFTVLISPSWGPSALLSRYGEKLLDPLSNSGWNIIIRPHPQSKKAEKDMLERLENKYKDNKNIVWDFERENIYSLSKADIMISDFSGIIYDYMFLCDKPVLYIKNDFDPTPYDADDIDHELWQFKVLKEAGIELKEEDLNNLVNIIKNAGDNESLANARKKASETAWQHQGESGKLVYDFMTKVFINA
ncbi:MAG: CDP-glycerol glycerophosphotransferase family protein [Treponema sp.]|nr:CDP-glycerol glycerophosphotransferase family protein [Treponema sp.]MCL2250386.1 CDP-glycerol glycerophosphotransferase family protein [Treponema sp.]